jgi:hypothetical protein
MQFWSNPVKKHCICALCCSVEVEKLSERPVFSSVVFKLYASWAFIFNSTAVFVELLLIAIMSTVFEIHWKYKVLFLFFIPQIKAMMQLNIIFWSYINFLI